MKVVVLWSGGKDSAYATYLALKKGYEIKYLLTMFPKKQDSWMFHFPCIKLTKLQAKALGIKQITQKTKGEKEKELEDLRKILEKIKNDIDAVVSGTIASNYQKSRIDKICEEIGVKSIMPLWNKDPEKLLKEEIHLGFEIIITGVFSEGFNESWLGRRIDEKCVEDLIKLNKRYGVHLSGEGGCYETMVLDCPIFKKRIQILKSRKIWEGMSGYLEIDKARLVTKEII